MKKTLVRVLAVTGLSLASVGFVFPGGGLFGAGFHVWAVYSFGVWRFPVCGFMLWADYMLITRRPRWGLWFAAFAICLLAGSVLAFLGAIDGGVILT